MTDRELVASTFITALRAASEKLRAQIGDQYGEHPDLDDILPRLVTEITHWRRS